MQTKAQGIGTNKKANGKNGGAARGNRREAPEIHEATPPTEDNWMAVIATVEKNEGPMFGDLARLAALFDAEQTEIGRGMSRALISLAAIGPRCRSAMEVLMFGAKTLDSLAHATLNERIDKATLARDVKGGAS